MQSSCYPRFSQRTFQETAFRPGAFQADTLPEGAIRGPFRTDAFRASAFRASALPKARQLSLKK